MLKTVMHDTLDWNELTLELPLTIEVAKQSFENAFGECRARTEDDFTCWGLYSDYGEEGSTYSFEQANKIAQELEKVASVSEKYAAAVFEYCCYVDVSHFDDVHFYDSKADFIVKVYDDYGLYDVKFLWTTVDMFLNDDYIFEALLDDGFIYKAENGVIIRWF
ncbi:hypothetical protein AB3329_01860 [Streptococcus sp. H31]|uniref:hypothetical protein n=1 Tax=Streptococcus huangxiaojuni TaxID=3237239 RepID=UPI0034A456A1